MTEPVAAPRPRLVWPWVLGGIILFFVLLTVVVSAVIIASGLAERASERNDRDRVEKVVLDLDAAYENADCDAFEALTSENARDDLSGTGSDYDCDDWQEVAESLTIDGDYGYTVRVLDSAVDGDTATVHTRERLPGDESYEFTYVLEKQDGDWVVVEYDLD